MNYNPYQQPMQHGQRPPYGPVPMQPYVPMMPPQQSSNGKSNDLSIGMFLRTSLLMMIPFVGWLMWIFWLFGASKYQARVNYVRASFIIGLIAIVIVVIIIVILVVAIGMNFGDLLSGFENV